MINKKLFYKVIPVTETCSSFDKHNNQVYLNKTISR